MIDLLTVLFAILCTFGAMYFIYHVMHGDE